MKEFVEYLWNTKWGQERKGNKKLFEADGPFFEFWEMYSLKEMCLFISCCHEMNDLLSCACVSLCLPCHYSEFRKHLLSIHNLV